MESKYTDLYFHSEESSLEIYSDLEILGLNRIKNSARLYQIYTETTSVLVFVSALQQFYDTINVRLDTFIARYQTQTVVLF